MSLFMQWFDKYFGSASADDKNNTKETNKNIAEECDPNSSCCKPTIKPNLKDAAVTDHSSATIDALFKQGNKITLKEEDSSLFDTLIASEHPTCVKFTAAWCKPCQQQEPEMVQLAKTMKDSGSQMRFVSVDVDVHDELFSSLEIMGIPHIRLYQRSELLETFTGRSIDGLEKACGALEKKTQ